MTPFINLLFEYFNFLFPDILGNNLFSIPVFQIIISISIDLLFGNCTFWQFGKLLLIFNSRGGKCS